MSTFDKYFRDVLNESVIDIPRNSLDPTVFEFPEDGPPIMHPIIKTQISYDIDKIKEVVPVVVYFVVGSILTKNYTPHSDIDVNVQIDPPDETVVEGVFDLLKILNGKLGAGTTHPINYFIIKDDYDLDKTDGAYDVANEAWIKESEDIDLNVQNYMDRFQSTIQGIDFNVEELRRDIIDLEALKGMNEGQIRDLETRTEEKMKEIEDDAESLVRHYMNVTTLRKQAFEKDMSPTEIRKYGKKNKLPENVVYKLLERYYYFDFMKTLKNILKDDKITSSEINTIKRAGQEFWK